MLIRKSRQGAQFRRSSVQINLSQPDYWVHHRNTRNHTTDLNMPSDNIKKILVSQAFYAEGTLPTTEIGAAQ